MFILHARTTQRRDSMALVQEREQLSEYFDISEEG